MPKEIGIIAVSRPGDFCDAVKPVQNLNCWTRDRRKGVNKLHVTTLFFVLAVGLLGPAIARSADAAEIEAGCEPVLKAIQAMNSSPRFHWKMSATTPNRKRPSRHEEIVFNDVVYMTPPGPGKWMRMQMTAADRTAFAAREMEQNPIGDCRAGQSEDLGGVEVQTYHYQQRPAQQSAVVSASKLWIGTKDGLPRRIESLTGDVSVLVTVDYDNVEPPYR
jgi:hypothetical protein